MSLRNVAPRHEGADPSVALSRRSFLKISAAAGGGLLLGFQVPWGLAQTDPATGEFTPNAFIRINKDGSIGLIIPQVEMGQGTFTSCPMLVAEELAVDLSQVKVEQAPPSDALYTNPLVGF
ncbi:MAG: molybdopterin-dependent oxidoreductase, partial [Acidobacteria bacterium]|nr:molybdopterin-dependent oxidoreductase [Acidobacteriota bacterium]